MFDSMGALRRGGLVESHRVSRFWKGALEERAKFVAGFRLATFTVRVNYDIGDSESMFTSRSPEECHCGVTRGGAEGHSFKISGHEKLATRLLAEAQGIISE